RRCSDLRRDPRAAERPRDHRDDLIDRMRMRSNAIARLRSHPTFVLPALHRGGGVISSVPLSFRFRAMMNTPSRQTERFLVCCSRIPQHHKKMPPNLSRRDRRSERDEHGDQRAIEPPEVLLAPEVSLEPALLLRVLVVLGALVHPAKLTERYVLVISAPRALFATGVPPRHTGCLARREELSSQAVGWAVSGPAKVWNLLEGTLARPRSVPRKQQKHPRNKNSAATLPGRVRLGDQ